MKRKILISAYVLMVVIIVLLEIIGYKFMMMFINKNQIINHFYYFKIFIILFLFIIFMLSIYRIIKFYMDHIKDLNKHNLGDTRFAKQSELEEQYQQVPKYGNFEGKGGVVVGWTFDKERMLVDSSATNTSVVGISRSGKGELLLFSTIDNLSRGSIKPSMVIFDKKPELYNHISSNLKEQGYNVKLLNLNDLTKSINFNPLELVKNYWIDKKKSKAQTELISVAENLIHQGDGKKDIWLETARILFRSGVLALLEEAEAGVLDYKEVTLANTYFFLSDLSTVQSDKTMGLNIYFNNKVNELSSITFNSINLPPGNTWNSIKMSALPKLEYFAIEDIAKLTSSNSLELLDFGYSNEPIALFISFPTMNQQLENFAAMYVDQLFTRLDEHTQYTKGKLDRELYFVLDEIASIRKIDTIGKIQSTGLGKGMRTIIGLQDPDQLEKMYSKAEKTEILRNCSNQICILSNNTQYNEEFSKLIGSYTYEEKTKSGGFGEEKSFSINFKERRLIRADEIPLLEEGEAIISRINYRRDYKGRKIKSYPIANIGENKMLFRYEYLDLDYKSIDELPFLYDDNPYERSIEFNDYLKTRIDFVQQEINLNEEDKNNNLSFEEEEKKPENLYYYEQEIMQMLQFFENKYSINLNTEKVLLNTDLIKSFEILKQISDDKIKIKLDKKYKKLKGLVEKFEEELKGEK